MVVASNEVPVSLGDADLVCDQPHPRSRDGAWQARSSIVVDAARDDRDLRGAIWNSAYEALILFVLVIVLLLVLGDKEAPHSGAATAKSRRAGWVCFVLIIAIALLLERRIPSLSILHSSAIFKNWSRTIGELAHVSPANPIRTCASGFAGADQIARGSLDCICAVDFSDFARLG